jgi:hypothetical protein
MAIKGGDLIHVGNSVLIDRIQTGGPGQVNIPTEKIYELGNYQSVASVLDTPDLSFTLESLDASAEIESMFLGTDFATDAEGTLYDIGKCLPMDVIGQFKAGRTAVAPFDVIGSVALPYLYLESLSYRFGIRDNASQSATLRGDSIFWNPGSSFVQTAVGTGIASQAVILAHLAYPYNGDDAGVRYALSVELKSGRRLRYGVDYTETPTGAGAAKQVTVTVTAAVAVTDEIRVVYCSSTVAAYPQNSHAADSATRPAAIRGRNIDVYVGGVLLANQWTNVQSASVEWRVQLDRDEEFGNSQVVNQDFDVPTVSGSVEVKPQDPAEILSKVKQITGAATDTEAIGALQREAQSVDIVLKSPTDGSVIKTLYIPDAKFTVPGYSGRVQQKLTLQFNFESDSGVLEVYKGARP